MRRGSRQRILALWVVKSRVCLERSCVFLSIVFEVFKTCDLTVSFLFCFCAFLSPFHGPQGPWLLFIHLPALSGFSAFEVSFRPMQWLSGLPAFLSSLIQTPGSFGSYCFLPISAEKQEVLGVRGRNKSAQDHRHNPPLWCPVPSSPVPSEMETESPIDLFLCVECAPSLPGMLGMPSLSFSKALPPWAAVSEFRRLFGKLYSGEGVSVPQRKRHFFTVSSWPDFLVRLSVRRECSIQCSWLKCIYLLGSLVYFIFPSGFLSKILCDKALIYIGVIYLKTLIIETKLLR